ncbi:MAG: DUF3440 domain-containing protein [Desulfobulbus sp.]|jgi:predicted phosphoadenosine phosphosulfate sulfurtransferase|uniref:phosphoadenosine phosphosulfate reductase n=1 Tax=Desulfobulbus sp. TaxID=895 RepID=UPI00284C899F|nr:DUF3440 domain-containing protein [Desulfobulbus sp.]MDR2551428.1 DUF3440 domain-containing protein [Desulfobulbus sp.]
MKCYLDIDVLTAARKRIGLIFSEFERICVSFSGGKDSGVMLNLAIQEARRRGRKITVLIIDLEGQYALTVDYIARILDVNADVLCPYWVCLPINLRNAVSMYQPFWCAWDPEQQDKWIRMPPNRDDVITDQDFFPFYRYRMEFEEFIVAFNRWFGGNDLSACLVGIRSDESLNRYRTIMSDSKATYKGHSWTTLVANSTYSCFPIYDWGTEDIWTANGKNGWDYNKLYDVFYRAGVGIHEMRICQPYGDDQRIGLDLFRVIEPETWAKVVNRVSGANFGNIYCGSKMLGYRQVNLPQGHTWKSYTKLLLASLPPEAQASYKERFLKFICYWHRQGSPVRNNMLNLLPPEAAITDKIATRGKKDKKLVRYRSIPDHLDSDLESEKLAPTWRRMAACILKNDHLCKGLSFSQTKNQVERIKALVEKYRDI